MTAQLAFTLDAPRIDPTADAKSLVRALIKADARANGGAVSSCRVRRALDGRVPPKLVGQCYAAMVREGVLEKCGHEISDDRKGGNAGRLVNAAGRDLFVRACDAHAVNVDGSHAVTTSDDVPAWRDLPQAEAIRALEAEAGAR